MSQLGSVERSQKQCRLSTEAFQQRFRYVQKGNDSHQGYANKIKANLEEWLKSAEVYGGHDKVTECFAIEQFCGGIAEERTLWLEDRLTEMEL